MKKYKLIIMSLFTVIALTACGSDNDEVVTDQKANNTKTEENIIDNIKNDDVTTNNFESSSDSNSTDSGKDYIIIGNVSRVLNSTGEVKYYPETRRVVCDYPSYDFVLDSDISISELSVTNDMLMYKDCSVSEDGFYKTVDCENGDDIIKDVSTGNGITTYTLTQNIGTIDYYISSKKMQRNIYDTYTVTVSIKEETKTKDGVSFTLYTLNKSGEFVVNSSICDYERDIVFENLKNELNQYYNDYKNAYGILYSTDKIYDTNSFIGFMNNSIYITKDRNGVTYTGITSDEAIQYLVADTYAKQIASKLGIIGNNISDEEKVYKMCKWYVDNRIVYDYTYSNYKAYNAFIDKTCICQGYAESFYLLCKYAGIKCEYNDMPQICHIDNYIYISNNKYEIDITNTDNWINGEVMSIYSITEENVYRITQNGFKQ